MNLTNELTDDALTIRPCQREDVEKISTHYAGILLNRKVVGKTIYNARMFSLLPSDFGLVAQL